MLADIVSRVKPGDVVFLPSLRMPRYVDQWAKMQQGSVDAAIFGKDSASTLEGAVRAATPVLQQLNAKGARVIVSAPNLLLKLPLYRCADAYDAMNPICSDGADVNRADFERLRASMLGAVTALTQSVPDASVWDPFPVLCPPGPVCHAYMDGRPLFFDGDHLSGFANRLLLPSFEEAVGTEYGTRGVAAVGD